LYDSDKFNNKMIKITLYNNVSRNAPPVNSRCYKLTFKNHSSSTLCNKQPIRIPENDEELSVMNNKTISESHFNTICDDKRFRRRSVHIY